MTDRGYRAVILFLLLFSLAGAALDWALLRPAAGQPVCELLSDHARLHYWRECPAGGR